MATKAETSEKNSSETIEVSKDQFENILKGYEYMKNQVALLNRQAAENSAVNGKEFAKLEEERRLLEIVRQANEKSDELVDVHIDLGAIRSNKNFEVSINGEQTIIPKGKTVQVKRCLKEIIDNSQAQRDIAMGLQEERNAEYEAAEASGAFKT